MNIEVKTDRLRQGRARLLEGRAVVPTEAIALLSGVSFGSVVKVIGAINALQQYAGTDFDSLLTVADIPLECVDFNDPAEKNRIDRTRELVEDLAYEGCSEELGIILRLEKRFLSG